MTEHDHLARLDRIANDQIATDILYKADQEAIAWAVKTIRELQAAEKLRESVREYASDGEQRGGAGLLLEYHKQAEEVKRLREASWRVIRQHQLVAPTCLQHRPLRSPMCHNCQLDARIEELHDIVEAALSGKGDRG